jgi:hypothetical protein
MGGRGRKERISKRRITIRKKVKRQKEKEVKEGRKYRKKSQSDKK